MVLKVSSFFLNNDDEFIRDLYNDYHIEGISRNSNLTNKLNADTFDEVIIRNF